MFVRRGLVASLTTALLVLAGCAGNPPPSSRGPSDAPSAARSSAATEPVGLAMTCSGEGAPVVVLEAGLDTGGSALSSLAARLAGSHRVCTYDRAGVGRSPALPAGAPAPWPGSSADALASTLAEHGERPPYVVLGWSYGGMVAQAFATRHRDLLAGLVLEDSSVPDQFVGDFWGDIAWVDGGREVDQQRTTDEIGRVDLADLPVVVLTAGEARGRMRRLWFGYHDRLAASSSDSVHVEAVGSGHEIHVDAEDLVVAAVDEVVMAARAGTGLDACDGRFSEQGGRCRPPG